MNRGRGTSSGPAQKMVESSTFTTKLPHSKKLPEPAELAASCNQLRHQLKLSQRALKRTGEHLRLQETRSRQLVTACAVKLRERQGESERQLQLKDRQFQHILQQLAVLQSRLKREQNSLTSQMQEQEQVTIQQAKELDRLRRSNRRLVNKVNRLSEPCSRCGAKPDSGISDCDDTDEKAAKVARRSEADSCDSAPAVGGATTSSSASSASPHRQEPGGVRTPEGNGGNGGSSAPASPPGIMKVAHEPRTPPVTTKTVTFSLQDDKENEKPAPSERQHQSAKAPIPVTSRPMAVPSSHHRAPLPRQPCIIPPPSININGKTYGQPSIVDTISQLLGADLEWPTIRRPALVPKKLSVIPEGNESSRDELSEPEYENVRVETLGESSVESDGGKVAGDSPPIGANEKIDTEVQSNNYRNVPRSRFNINLIMSESEGVQIKDNFEEFKFDEDMASSVCSDTASDRSADNGADANRSLLRRAGDGAESEQPDNNNATTANKAAISARTRTTNGNYEKFLELSGLSQKALRTSARLFTNHRSVMRPKDVKQRQRVRLPATEQTGSEDLSPTSVRYYSDQL